MPGQVDVTTTSQQTQPVAPLITAVPQEQELTIAEDFQKFIEIEVLKIIKDLAENGQTSKERIQEIARLTLTLIHPGMSLEELYRNAVKLDDNHSELCPVVSSIMRAYEEKYSQKAVGAVSSLIKNGKYDEAQDLVKKILDFKIKN